MKEIKEIIAAFDKAIGAGEQSALATVVHVEGSSYRRPGARMLITENGQLTGAISGGCLEGDALRKALLVMNEKKAKLVTYDTMDEDDVVFGAGLGCNGIIQVLIEPVDVNDPYHPIVFLKKAAEQRQHSVLVTLFDLSNRKNEQPGTCLFLGNKNGPWHQQPVLHDLLLADCNLALQEKKSSFKNYISNKHNLTAFIEILNPTASLVIFGAGNDVVPLVQMAQVLGWQTTVADARPAQTGYKNFESIFQVPISNPGKILEKIEVDDYTCFLLMTHNFNYDKSMLKQLLPQQVRYIGMLGPEKKKQRILQELREEGMAFSQEQLACLHSPAGLDIGSETPEEIALSILAEIKAALAAIQQPVPLRNKKNTIHQRSASAIEKKYA